MTFTHLPTALSEKMGQPFGYVSAAEGFVMLSAFLAGRVYMSRGMKSGPQAMRSALWARAAKVYRHHLSLLAFGASVVLAIAVVNGEEAITSIFKEYLRDPVTTGVAALALVYQPSLFDILPMYVLFLLFTPWVLGRAMRSGWTLPLAISFGVWVGAQVGLRASFYEGVAFMLGRPLPIEAIGAFNPFAWQFLWMIGLWLGTAVLQGSNDRMKAPPRTLALLAVLAAGFLTWRHLAGQVPFEHSAWGLWGPLLNHGFDKWDLGGLRLLNLFALTLLVAAYGPALARRFTFQPLTQLGRASLAVFTAHLVCCLLALAMFGPANRTDGSAALDLLLLISCFAVLQATAAVVEASGKRKLQKLPPVAIPMLIPLPIR